MEKCILYANKIYVQWQYRNLDTRLYLLHYLINVQHWIGYNKRFSILAKRMW